MTAAELNDVASLGAPIPAPPQLVGLLDDERAPWDWADQDDASAAELTRHLETFVAYLNARYAWNSDQTVPPCWHAHGPLVEELTTLMWSRWAAFSGPDATVDAAQTWHTYTLPAFLSRLAFWIGPQTLPDCRAGNHQPSRLTSSRPALSATRTPSEDARSPSARKPRR
jgi:hypothetical protein